MSHPSHPEMMPLILQSLRDEGMPYRSAVEHIALRLRLPSSRIHGFISQFPELTAGGGRTLVRVCSGPACMARGAEAIYQSLSEKMPPDVSLERDPGLIEWHNSPAVCIETPDWGKTLIELSGPEDLETVLAATKKTVAGGAEPRVPASDDLPAWWLEEEGQAAIQDPEAVVSGFVSDSASAVRTLENSAIAKLSGMGEIISATRDKLSGLPGPELIICDTAGKEVENSMAYLASLLHPRGVVLGAFLGALLCGAGKLVFYLPLNDGQLRKAIGEAAENLASKLEIDIALLEGPVHIPSSYEIGRTAIVQGRMLWEEASIYARNNLKSGPQPVIVLPATSALKLSRIAAGYPEVPCVTGMIDQVGNHSLLAVGNGFRLPDGVKAVYTGFRLLPATETKGEWLDEASQLVLLGSSKCMVEWSRYLASRAADACCGGCTAGRTAPAAAVGLIDEILEGRGDEKLLDQLSSLLISAGELALCPRLGQILEPMSSALNNFGEEFRAHGLEGVCRSDSFLTSASPQTEKR